MGAGQIQRARCLFGAEQPGAGQVLLDGQALKLKNTTSTRAETWVLNIAERLLLERAAIADTAALLATIRACPEPP